MARGYQERVPKEEKIGRIDHIMVIRYPNHMKKWEITFLGPHYERYEAIKYWPTGEIQCMEHGMTDKLIEFLHGLRDQKAASAESRDVHRA